MHRLSTSLRAALAGIVGGANVIDEADRLLVYESDGLTQYRSTPRAVVLPGSTSEVAGVVRLLAAEGIPMVARGAGTGLSGGCVANEDAVVLGLARMNRILHLDPVARLARVEAGTVNQELTTRAAPHGLFYAPDPSSQTACTLGGNVAENSGGPHCMKYGVTTRYVTGLTAVTAAGDVVELGGAGRSDPIDLVGLVVGSEGCFAIVTEIELRLLPRPTAVRTLLGVFDSPTDAGSAVSAIVARGLLPAALEIIDRNTIEAVESSAFAAGYPTGAGAALVVEFDGDPIGIDEDAELAAAICSEFGAIEVRRAADETERVALWKGRKKAFGAMGRLAPDLVVQDATVPRSVLPVVLDRIEEIGRRYELRVANVFHAGDGNLHPNLLFDRRDPDQLERVERASNEIMRACVDLGGTITGEHGVGLDKRRYMTLVHGPGELAAMRRVRDAFDPGGLLNPGKVLPKADEGSSAPPPSRADGALVPSAVRRESAGGRSGIVEYRPEDLTITVDAALPWTELDRVTSASGQWVPWSPPFDASASVGEVVEGGTANLWSVRYGELRDLVLGVRLRPVGSEESLRLGGRVVKNVAGFDLLRPVVGSGGRFGRVEEVTLRLYPLPPARRRWRIPIELEEAEAAVRALAGLPSLPAAVVLTTGPEDAILVVEGHGTAAQIDALGAALAAALERWGRPQPASELGEWATPSSATGRQPRLRSALPTTDPTLRSALRSLLVEEAGDEVRSLHDLGTGRDFWWAPDFEAEVDRWVGLARRWSEAGGEIVAIARRSEAKEAGERGGGTQGEGEVGDASPPTPSSEGAAVRGWAEALEQVRFERPERRVAHEIATGVVDALRAPAGATA